MNIEEIVASIPYGFLRSYSWVAERMGRSSDAARATGQDIARETLRRWPTAVAESSAKDGSSFPWWRVVGRNGDVRTVREDEAWYHRQVFHLQEEGHRLVPSSETDGLRIDPLPQGFE